MSDISIPTIALANGVEMPMLGYGTYRTSAARTEGAVADALKVGYRSIDTAQCYGNESAVGSAVASSGLSREEVFITTKTWTNGYEDTRRSIDASLSALRTDYVDLLLIHEPTGDIPGIYRALEDAYRTGKARAIGVSNFIGDSLASLLRNAEVKPMVNQVETHPLRAQFALQRECGERGIVMESWSPLVAGSQGLLHNPTIEDIAHAHGKSPAQVVLRWLVQRGVPVIPKSLDVQHMRENLAIFGFSLTEANMEAIASLDTDRSQFGWW